MALTPWQQGILDQSRNNPGDGSRQGSVQDMVELAGLPPTQESYLTVMRILTENNIAAPLTRAQNQANLAVAAGPGGKPLTPYQQGVYNDAKASGKTAQDIAQTYNNDYNVPVSTRNVLDILYGAGLELPGRTPNTSPGVTPTGPATNPRPPEIDGGLPGRQPTGGMYGPSPTPVANVSGQIPNSPSLRGVFSHARRRQSPGYRGQTDTILTGARGVLGSAVLRKKMLMGS